MHHTYMYKIGPYCIRDGQGATKVTRSKSNLITAIRLGQVSYPFDTLVPALLKDL